MSELTTQQQHFDIALIIDQTKLTQQARGLEVTEHAASLERYHETEIGKLKPQLDELDAQSGLISENIRNLTELLEIVNKNRTDLRAAILAHMAGVSSLRETSLDTQKKV